jgi:hypothetical protein
VLILFGYDLLFLLRCPENFLLANPFHVQWTATFALLEASPKKEPQAGVIERENVYQGHSRSLWLYCRVISIFTFVMTLIELI